MKSDNARGEKGTESMEEITFITGNQKKADYLAKYLGFPIKHVKLDLDEIQSMDLKFEAGRGAAPAQAPPSCGKPGWRSALSSGRMMRLFLQEPLDFSREIE